MKQPLICLSWIRQQKCCCTCDKLPACFPCRFVPRVIKTTLWRVRWWHVIQTLSPAPVPAKTWRLIRSTHALSTAADIAVITSPPLISVIRLQSISSRVFSRCAISVSFLFWSLFLIRIGISPWFFKTVHLRASIPIWRTSWRIDPRISTTGTSW